MDILLIVGGLLGLAGGAEVLLRGAVGLAKRFGVSAFMIGLTVVAVATSLPELLVSFSAAWNGAPDIILGNIVGSNIANMLLILGVAALIAPFALDRKAVGPDFIVMLGVSVLLAGASFLGVIEWPVGVGMLTLYFGYLFWTYRRRLADPAGVEEQAGDVDELAGPAPSTLAAIAMLAGGLVVLLLGANWLIDGAINVARDFGVSEAAIGLTLVAIGTSLPELAACIVSAMRGHAGLALGNAIGSNIMNVLAIIGVSSLPIAIPAAPEILRFDIWAMLAAAILPAAYVMLGVKTATRVAGVTLLALYVGYLGVRFAIDWTVV